MKTPSTTKKLIAGGMLVLAGFGAGAALAITDSASAAGDAPTAAAGEGPERPQDFAPRRASTPTRSF